MPDSPLNRIDFARYQRMLGALAGRDCPIRIIDVDGRSVWGCAPGPGAGEGPDAALGRRLTEVARDDVSRASGVNRLELGVDAVFYTRPLGPSDAPAWGWIAVATRLEHDAQRPLESDQLADALEDVAEGIVAEALRHRDAELMTEELAECYEELHLVYALDEHVRLGTGADGDLFERMLKATAQHLDVDVVAFVRPEDDLCIYATSLSREIHNLDLVLIETRGDLFRFVQASGESVVLNDTGDLRRAYVFTDMPYRVLACPIRSGSKVTAQVVLLNHMHKRPYTNSDRRLAEVLANQLANLAKNVLLLQSMSKFTEQLAAAMVEAVEAKDPYTRGHSERVNFISMEIGNALGLQADELQDLYWGSLLHDVGKIGIPDAVLCKPARLTKDEYTFIMVHPERSYEILRHIDQLKNAVPGARHHQEMYNGRGYPHGLKGERIPLHARIMAVADTYDSITSSRAYRAGRSHEVAIAEIDRVCGTQLDPGIVAVFKKLCAAEPEWLHRFKIRRDNSTHG